MRREQPQPQPEEGEVGEKEGEYDMRREQPVVTLEAKVHTDAELVTAMRMAYEKGLREGSDQAAVQWQEVLNKLRKQYDELHAQLSTRLEQGVPSAQHEARAPDFQKHIHRQQVLMGNSSKKSKGQVRFKG